MRIDLPQCNFKNCRFSFDGNCTNKIEYDRCEYRLAKGELTENDSHKVKYALFKDGEVLIFDSEKDACEYLGVVKCSVASCNRKGCRCKGYRIAKMDGKEEK